MLNKLGTMMIVWKYFKCLALFCYSLYTTWIVAMVCNMLTEQLIRKIMSRMLKRLVVYCREYLTCASKFIVFNVWCIEDLSGELWVYDCIK